MDAKAVNTTLIPVSDLRPNMGQIEGLPANPRFIRNDRFDKLVESIRDNPEMMSLREIIAVEYKGQKVVVCGNMRLRALRKLGEKEAPVKLLTEETPVKFLRALTILDNNHFGDWDFDELANSWEVDLISAAGIDLPDFDTPDIEGEEEEDDRFTKIRFKLTEEQAGEVKTAISLMRKLKRKEVGKIMDNSNKNGNALYLICKEWNNE